jgi:hypothetical protein
MRAFFIMAETRAQQNRKIRQDALREQLAAKGLVQHVLEISNKLQEPEVPLEPNDIQRLRAAADIKLKLIDKYLPSLKGVELSQDPDNPIDMSWKIEVVNASNDNP